MNAVLRSIFLLPVLFLLSCEGEEKSREEARIQREVNQRVEVIRKEMKVSENRWHTARTVALCALAGGSLLWLMGTRGTGSNSRNPEARSRLPETRSRMIERPNLYGEEDDESEHDPYRR